MGFSVIITLRKAAFVPTKAPQNHHETSFVLFLNPHVATLLTDILKLGYFRVIRVKLLFFKD